MEKNKLNYSKGMIFVYREGGIIEEIAIILNVNGSVHPGVWIAKSFFKLEKVCIFVSNKNTIMKNQTMIQEINKGIERAQETINYELDMGNLANSERVAKYKKYIADMNELKESFLK